MTDRLSLASLHVASLAAPNLRAGRVTRKIKVVRGDEVLREIDGTDLGRALLARAGIELDVFPDPKKCRCGRRKYVTSVTCRLCRATCACGRQKARGSATCTACDKARRRRAVVKVITAVCGCGRRKSREAPQCQACRRDRLRAEKAARVQP